MATTLYADTVQPLDGRVLVQPDQAPDHTAGGVFCPEVAKDQPVQGVVVRCEPGLDVTIGDRVLMRHGYGAWLELAGINHILIKEEHILGVVS